MKKRSKDKQKKLDYKIYRAKMIKKSRQVPNFSILGADQANLFGIAWQNSLMEYPETMIWDLSIGTKESQGFKWMRFESRIRTFLKEKGIKALAYELPAGRNIKPIIHSSKLIAIIEKVCVELGIEYIEFSSSEVKKFATGNGNANKEKMVEAAKQLWGYEGEDDNEADALHILQLLKAKIL